jgi:aspartate dehydrogenase
VDRGDVGADVVAVAARDRDKAKRSFAGLRRAPDIVDFVELAARADVVIEALPASLLRDVALPAIEAGRTLLVLSSGALLRNEDLIQRAAASGARILVPSGALLALDAVRAAAEGKIRSVQITTRKPPQGLIGAPYLVEHGISLAALTEPLRVFSGSAREAAVAFPANVNVAATLSLAGIGPDATRVEVWADPGLERNIHQIEVDAESARFSATVESIPSEENPRTGKLTPLSVVSALRALSSPLRIGS